MRIQTPTLVAVLAALVGCQGTQATGPGANDPVAPLQSSSAVASDVDLPSPSAAIREATPLAASSTLSLVWGDMPDGGTQTLLVERSATDRDQVRVVRAYDGIILAAPEGLMRFETPEVSIPLADCGHVLGETDAPASPSMGPVQRAEIVALQGEGRRELLPAPQPKDFMDPADVDHGIELVASIGTQLFLRQFAYTYHCGAHGDLAATYSVIDLAHGGVRHGMDARETAGFEAERSRAYRRFVDDVDAFPVEPSDVELVAAWPELSAAGAFRFTLHFTAFDCYACSDGEWGSYSRSTYVPTSWTPRELEDEATPGRWLPAFAADRGLTVRGYAEVDRSLAALDS